MKTRVAVYLFLCFYFENSRALERSILRLVEEDEMQKPPIQSACNEALTHGAARCTHAGMNWSTSAA